MKLPGLIFSALAAVVSCFPGLSSHSIRNTLETSYSGAFNKVAVPNVLIDNPTVAILESFNDMMLDTPKVAPRPNTMGLNWYVAHSTKEFVI
jgi:hypothetical protein